MGIEAVMARSPDAACPYWWIDPCTSERGACISTQDSTELVLEADRRYSYHDFKAKCDFQDDKSFALWRASREKGQKENVNMTNSNLWTSPRRSPRPSPRISPRASPRACSSP